MTKQPYIDLGESVWTVLTLLTVTTSHSSLISVILWRPTLPKSTDKFVGVTGYW